MEILEVEKRKYELMKNTFISPYNMFDNIDIYFEKIDDMMLNIDVGTIVYKWHGYDCIGYKITSIIDSENGIVEIYEKGCKAYGVSDKTYNACILEYKLKP